MVESGEAEAEAEAGEGVEVVEVVEVVEGVQRDWDWEESYHHNIPIPVILSSAEEVPRPPLSRRRGNFNSNSRQYRCRVTGTVCTRA